MKKFFLVVLLVLLTGDVLAAEVRQVSHSLALSDPDKPATIAVSLFEGSIRIVGHKGKEVVVDAAIQRLARVDDAAPLERRGSRHNHSDDDKKDNNQANRFKGLKRVTNTAIQLEIEEDNNEVSIETMNRNQRVDLTIKVPFNSNLEVGLHRGDDIKIENVQGSIEVMNARGAITATGIRGPIVAECARNDLVVVFDEFATIKPSSLNAHRGNIDVSLPKSSKVLVEVKNFQGEIYSGIKAEFKNTDSIKNKDSNNGQQITIGDAMVAKLNGGNQKLMLNTYRGDIFIREN